jgi:hypothetical protein
MCRIPRAFDDRATRATRAAREQRECWLAFLACDRGVRHGRMPFSQVRYARRDLAAARNEPDGWWSR